MEKTIEQHERIIQKLDEMISIMKKPENKLRGIGNNRQCCYHCQCFGNCRNNPKLGLRRKLCIYNYYLR